jgi:hypothetical protein
LPYKEGYHGNGCNMYDTLLNIKPLTIAAVSMVAFFVGQYIIVDPSNSNFDPFLVM